MNLVKVIILIVGVIIMQGINLNAQVAVNASGTPPHSSAMLDVESSTHGMLVPRMKTTDMLAIASPAIGLLVYNTTEGAFYNFNGSVWTRLVSGSSALLQDADKDTRVETEKNPDEDIIRFSTLGTEYFSMNHGRLSVDNTGFSVFLGKDAGAADDLNNRYNVFVGHSAGLSNTFGNNNTAVGAFAFINNVGGRNSVAVGNNALLSNQNGNSNVAVGASAMFNNLTGYSNVAVGSRALAMSPTGRNMVAVGDSALFNQATNAQGNYGNVAVGSKALYTNSTGYFNSAFGYNAGKANTIGHDNTAGGYNALLSNTQGVNNTAWGASALSSNQGGSENTAVGAAALQLHPAGSNNTALGSRSLTQLIFGDQNTAAGALALTSLAGGSFNTALGNRALYGTQSATGNTALGNQALEGNNTGSYNLAVGHQALMGNFDGEHNIAVGTGALRWCMTGQQLVAIGDSALYSQGNATQGFFLNTAVGTKSLFSNSDGWGNTATGSLSLVKNTTGSTNTAVGYSALYSSVAGSGNTALGYLSVWNSSSISNVTALGSNTSCLGGISNAIAIGYNASVNASNKAVIGNSSMTSIGGFAGWTTYPSDARFKREVRENVPGLEFISRLRPVTYRVDAVALDQAQQTDIPDGMHPGRPAGLDELHRNALLEKEQVLYTGFIAQEVEAAAKELGYNFSGVDAPKNDHDFYGIRYAEFVVPLVKAVQEQQALIDSQNERIAGLEKRNEQLEQMFRELNARLAVIEKH